MKLVKDILKATEYRPNPADPNFVVNVTTKDIDHWSRTFNDMKNATDPKTGESFPIGIPLTYEHPPKGKGSDPAEWRTGDPRFRAGWVEDIYRDGDTMMAVVDVPDDYAKDLVDNGCFVSPKFGGTWKDSHERVWSNPIHHIALTTKPVALNQSKTFVPALAFSRDGEPESPFSQELFFSTSMGEFAQWSQPEETEMPQSLTPEEAIDRILENPDVRARYEEKYGTGVYEFSATPGMGLPPGMPPVDPAQGGMPPAPEQDMEQDDAPDAVATCMQIMHSLSETLHEGMQAMARLHGVKMDSDEDDLPPPPAPEPQAPQVTASPAVVSMSRDISQFSRDELIHHPLVAALENKCTRMERAELVDRVEALFDSGRATRVKADAMIAEVGQYEFSRQTELQNVLLLARIKELEETQPGSAVSSGESGIQFSRKAQVVSHNTAFNTEEEVTDERADEILANQYGIKK